MFTQEVVCTTQAGQEVDVLMAYTENDPLAVTFSFSHGDTFVSWDFARDLLFEAFGEGSAGQGDIILGLVEDETLIFTLNDSEGNWTTFFFPASEVKIFLEQTEEMVPYGDESRFLDIDGEWEAFVKDQI